MRQSERKGCRKQDKNKRGDRLKEVERKALSVAGVETTALRVTAPNACGVEKERLQLRTFRRDSECKKRVFKQKVRCEQGNKANTYGDLHPGPWLAPTMVAKHSPQLGQRGLGSNTVHKEKSGTHKATPKDRQIKANGSGKRGTTREKQRY